MKSGAVTRPRASQLKTDFQSCPVQASLGTLGRKWALLVLRNIGLYRAQRFTEMLNITPGLTSRMLSMRLAELEAEGFIEVVERGKNYSKWDLTEKGRDTLPILMVLVQFGSKWHAAKVFADKMPRPLNEVFEESYIGEILGDKELLIQERGAGADSHFHPPKGTVKGQ